MEVFPPWFPAILQRFWIITRDLLAVIRLRGYVEGEVVSWLEARESICAVKRSSIKRNWSVHIVFMVFVTTAWKAEVRLDVIEDKSYRQSIRCKSLRTLYCAGGIERSRDVYPYLIAETHLTLLRKNNGSSRQFFRCFPAKRPKKKLQSLHLQRESRASSLLINIITKWVSRFQFLA